MGIFYGYIGLPEDKITNFGRIQVATNPKSKVDFNTVLCASTEIWARVDQLVVLGMAIPPLMTGILIMGPYKPLLLGWWPNTLLYGNNGSF